MRDLIRRILREQTQPDVEVDIMNYKGDDKEINRLKALIYSGKILSEKEIEYAEIFFGKKMTDVESDEMKNLKMKISNWIGDNSEMKNLMVKVHMKEPLNKKEIEFAKEFFEKEKISRKKDQNTMLKKITNYQGGGAEQKSEIKRLGIEVYSDIIKSDLTIFLNKIFNPKLKLKISVPSDGWFEKNLEDLRIFYNSTKKYHNNFVEWTDNTKMTIGEKILELAGKLKRKDWLGIIEEGDWSILNKVDTNYISWGKDITRRQLNGDLPMGGDMFIIKKYFEKQDINDVLPKRWLDILKKMEESENIKIEKMSYAQVDFIEKFHEESEEIYNEFKETLQQTTRKGDDAEDDFFQLIRNKPDNFKDIKRYAIWGNVVDIVFGVDGSFVCNDGFRLVQVKSQDYLAKNNFIKKLKIPYLSVFPTTKSRNFKFEYFSENNPTKPKNFNTDFVNVGEREKPETYSDKEKRILGKTLGQPDLGIDYFSQIKKGG